MFLLGWFMPGGSLTRVIAALLSSTECRRLLLHQPSACLSTAPHCLQWGAAGAEGQAAALPIGSSVGAAGAHARDHAS